MGRYLELLLMELARQLTWSDEQVSCSTTAPVSPLTHYLHYWEIPPTMSYILFDTLEDARVSFLLPPR